MPPKKTATLFLSFVALSLTLLAAPRLFAAAPSPPSVPSASASASASGPPPPAPSASPIPLTSDDVARRARDTSFAVRARADERAAADEAVAGARAAFLPRLTGTARYTRLSNVSLPTLGNLVVAPPGAAPNQPPPDLASLRVVPLSFPMILDQYLGQATLQVPLSDYFLRLPQVHAAATANARAAALGEEAARLRAATDARLAYYGWARARLATGIARQSLEQARAHLADVRQAAAAGTASRADVLRVESQVAGAELLLTRALNLAAISEQQLRTAMHDDSRRPYEIGEAVEQAIPDPPGAGTDAATFDALRAEAASRRLEPRAIAEGAGAAREQATAALAVGLPRLDAVGNATYANPNPRIFPQEAVYRGTWDASVQLSWAITDLPAATARGARRARARRRSTPSAASCSTPSGSRSRRRPRRSPRRPPPSTARAAASAPPRSRTACAACCSRTAAPPASSSPTPRPS